MKASRLSPLNIYLIKLNIPKLFKELIILFYRLQIIFFNLNALVWFDYYEENITILGTSWFYSFNL